VYGNQLKLKSINNINTMKKLPLFEMNEPDNNVDETALFLKVRDAIDAYINPDGNPDDSKWDALYNKYSEDIANNNSDFLDDDDDTGAFGDSTLKHQVFDYFPYSNWPIRELPEGGNDLSTVVAAYVSSFYNPIEGDESTVAELEREIGTKIL
jgi:hypothetical protein